VQLVEEAALLVPAVALFVFVSANTGFSHHLRYVLPAFPFVFVWCSGLAAKGQRMRGIRVVVSAVLVICSAASSLSVSPHFISYFNELAGGPNNGHRCLLNSNIDWGQDLLYLKQWQEQHQDARPLYLRYWPNQSWADWAGIEYRRADPEIPFAGWYAISLNSLYGRRGQYQYLRQFRPVDRAGYSILIFHLDDGQVTELRRRMRLP
jgi:hypothetical protein